MQDGNCCISVSRKQLAASALALMCNVFVNGPGKRVVKMRGSKSHVSSEISQD